MTFTSESAALRATQGRNKWTDNANDLWVVVEGPEDSEWSVMRIEDAIEGEFLYSWVGGK